MNANYKYRKQYTIEEKIAYFRRRADELQAQLDERNGRHQTMDKEVIRAMVREYINDLNVRPSRKAR